MKTLTVTKDPFPYLNRNFEVGIKCTGSTMTYTTPKGKFIYIQSGGIRPKDFGLFSHVEKKAREGIEGGWISMPEFKPKFSTFYDSCREITLLDNVYEIDLKGAYWHEAFDLDMTDEYMFNNYNTTNKVDKLVRNISIGRLAAKSDFFMAKKGEKPKWLYSEKKSTYPAFWNVAANCDKKIRECIASLNKQDILFYWVDAVFVLGTPALKRAQEFFYHNGIYVKVKRVKLSRIHQKILVNCGREIKKYTLPNNKNILSKKY